MVKRVEIIDELIHEVLPENSVTKQTLLKSISVFRPELSLSLTWAEGACLIRANQQADQAVASGTMVQQAPTPQQALPLDQQ
jgi:hypothetical protein